MDSTTRQREYELRAIRKAEEKCLEEREASEARLEASERRAGRDFLRRTILPLADAIEDERQAILAAKAKPPTHALPLLSLSEMTSALVALRTIFNRVASRDAWDPPTHANVAVAIGRSCYWEWKKRRSAAYRAGKADPDLPDLARLLAGRRMKPRLAAFETLDASAEEWVALGAVVLELADHLHIVDSADEGRGLRASRRVQFAEKLAGRVEQIAADPMFGLVVAPAHRPMIVPPRPWAGLHGGGFLTSQETDAQEPETTHLVKHRGHKKQIEALEAAAKNGRLDTVYGAVNALQATPWRLNTRVYAVMQYAAEYRLALPGIPDWDRLDTLTSTLDPIQETRKDLKKRDGHLRRRKAAAQKTGSREEHDGSHADCDPCAEWTAIGEVEAEQQAAWDAYHRSKGVLEEPRWRLRQQEAALKARKAAAQKAFKLKRHGGPHPDCAACDEQAAIARLEAEVQAAREAYHAYKRSLAGDAGKEFGELVRERARLRSQHAKLEQLLATCNNLVGDAAATEQDIERLTFFFPYQIDYRGRAYSMVTSLNPQGNDHARALLEFADGKPLGADGRWWLAIHLANTYGKDKLSFADRVAWTHEHTGLIRELGSIAAEDGTVDPDRLGALPAAVWSFWEAADEKKKWQFLAACFEWAARDQPGFRSRLPVVLDASASGLQHLSALARDPDGAEATNLLRSAAGRPQDIYRRVAERLQPMVEADLSSPPIDAEAEKRARFAAEWRGKIDRTVVKQGVMTTPYGVTGSGRRKQVHALMEEDAQFDEFQDRWGAAGYLAEKIGSCIAAEMKLAHGVMTWLRKAAEQLAGVGRGITYTTPTGLPVVVWNYSYDERPVKVKWTEIRSGTRRELTLRNRTPGLLGIDVDEQKDTITPNFVHSLDAALMMLSISRLRSEGLMHFITIHDSFGVHASDVGQMLTALKEEFVGMYRPSLLDAFIDEQLGALKEAERAEVETLLATKPPRGNLDIDQVLDAEYMFS